MRGSAILRSSAGDICVHVAVAAGGMILRAGRTRPFAALSGAGLIMRTLVLGGLALLASGLGHLLFHPALAHSDGDTTLVRSLIDRDANPALVSESLAAELGYSPVVEQNRMVNPGGSCSTPVPIGPDAFATACRAHDLGYDALRAAASLGPWARFGLDARLYADLLETCASAECRAVATVYYGAVTMNSIRQGYLAPTDEPSLPWAALGVGVVGLSVLVGWRGSESAELRAGHFGYPPSSVKYAIETDPEGTVEPWISGTRRRERCSARLAVSRSPIGITPTPSPGFPDAGRT